MKSVNLKAILQEEPGSPSAPSLLPLERLANQTIVSQSTTNSSQPPEKMKPATNISDSTRSDAPVRPSEVPIQPEVLSTSLEPPPPTPVGFRRFRTIDGLRGETQSPAPLLPSPDVSEFIFHAIKNPPSAATPSFIIPQQETASLPNDQGLHIYVPIYLSYSVSPLTVPGSFGHFSRSRRKLYAVDELDAFRKATQARQTPPPPPAAALLSRSKSRTPSPQRRAAVSSPSSAVSQAPRDPSSSPIARSAPPTTPSPASLPSEPGSSPFPGEDENKKDDGPDMKGNQAGRELRLEVWTSWKNSTGPKKAPAAPKTLG